MPAPTTIIPFGPFQPDLDVVDAEVCLDAKNVFPHGTVEQNWYRAHPSLQPQGSLAQLPGPFTDLAKGLFYAKISEGRAVAIVGTTTKLYRQTGSGWTDVTGPLILNVPGRDFWQFEQFGDYVYATNTTDGLLRYDIGGGGNFQPVVGAPKFRYIKVVGDFMVGAYDGTAGPTNAFKVFNSGINNPTTWATGIDLASEQVLPDGGIVTGLALGGEGYCYVMQEHRVRRMIFNPGSDIAFRFEMVEASKGATEGYSTVAVAGNVLYSSGEGLYAIGPNGIQAIGNMKVNRWFRDNTSRTSTLHILGFSDSFATRVGWAFQTNEDVTRFNRVLWYDWGIDKFSYTDEVAGVWASLHPDADYIEKGVAAVSQDRYVSWLTGTPRTASIMTNKRQLVPGKRAIVTGLRPQGDFGGDRVRFSVLKAETASVGGRVSDKEVVSLPSGVLPMRHGGRVHRFEMDVTPVGGARPWQTAQGIEVSLAPSGLR